MPSHPYDPEPSLDRLTRTTRRPRGKDRWDDDDPRPDRDGARRRPEPGRSGLADTLAESLREGDGSHLSFEDPTELSDVPGGGDRRTTWDVATHGPKPRPAWLVTDLSAVDVDLGVLKTGKEADVHLVRRFVPSDTFTQGSCLLAAKRYRSAEHRMFHRDAGYLEGRRVRRSREMRAMARRTEFGKDLLSGQWANAEFAALTLVWERTHALGTAAVPYPVSLDGTELLLEFVGDAASATAAPRLAQCRDLSPDRLRDLWRQLVETLRALAGLGYAHGDLSPYNLLVDDERLVMIDLPQIVDLVANPQGPRFLERDVRVVAEWFAGRGLSWTDADTRTLTGSLLEDAVG